MRGVLVAGGTGALGAGVLRVLLDAGYPVTSTWLVEHERQRIEKDFPGARNLTLIQADLMTAAGAHAAVAATDDIGAVVNLVGGFTSGPRTHDTELETFDRMFELNLRPGLLLVRAAFPRLLDAGGGAYVGVSARAALKPFKGACPYCTAKAAVLAFVQSLDADYRDDGIRCNAILPSVIDTPANRSQQPDADYSKWVRPDEIGRVIRFLISDESAPTSGAAVPVYGRA